MPIQDKHFQNEPPSAEAGHGPECHLRFIVLLLTSRHNPIRSGLYDFYASSCYTRVLTVVTL